MHVVCIVCICIVHVHAYSNDVVDVHVLNISNTALEVPRRAAIGC